METKAAKDRIQYLMNLADRTLASQETDTGTVPRHRVNTALFAELRSGCLAFILQHFGVEHPFYSEFDALVKGAYPKDVNYAIGILRAMKAELG